jgi:uncharacterized membrane protein YcaP (DUF421 family)
MDAVVRGLVIYAFLVLLFRIAGKRALSDITTFDFVLLLIVAEATQQGLLGDDFSVTNAFLVIITLVTADIGLSLLKRRWPKLEKVMEGTPVVIVENGRPIATAMRRERVDEDDVLAAARELQGLERMDQIKYAVLERSGGISIIPQSRER